jgi:hypothetical protein
MATRTGMSEATQIAKHLCRLLAAFSPAMRSVISASVTSSVITAEQGATLNIWLDGANSACDVLRAITGY